MLSRKLAFIQSNPKSVVTRPLKMVYMLYRVIGWVANVSNIMNANDPGYNCSEHIITNHKIRNTSSR